MGRVAARAAERISSGVGASRWLSVCFIVSVAACGRGPSQTDRAISQLRADIARLAVDQERLMARVAIMEADAQRAASPDGARQPSSDGTAPEQNRLATGTPVGAGSGSSSTSGSVGSGSVASGSVGSGSVASGCGASDCGPLVPSNSAPSGGAAGESAPAVRAGQTARMGASREYDAALAQLKAKSYDLAIEGLTAFLVRYPHHSHAEDAMFWRAQAFQAKGEYALAKREYEGQIARFAFGNRTAEALLGLGICEQKLGQAERAEEAFSQLRERYPKSAAAQRLPGR